jgi:hypothetical protein
VTETRAGVADGDPFSVDNLPYGSVAESSRQSFTAVRIGGYALNLTHACAAIAPDLAPLFARGTLDGFVAADHPV